MPGHRQTIRHPDHDYTSAATYLVTVCTHDRAPILGAIVDGHVQLSAAGQHAHDCWSAIPEHFAHVSLDEFVIMPDHVHGIVCMDAAPERATHASPLPAGSLGAVIGSFKSAATKRINLMRNTPGAVVWQRNYHDQIVTDLVQAREYIWQNPSSG
jgi:REP element-mobilizing transposase RayT